MKDAIFSVTTAVTIWMNPSRAVMPDVLRKESLLRVVHRDVKLLSKLFSFKFKAI